jgi:DNA-binding CsgD family transcriptional regulator
MKLVSTTSEVQWQQNQNFKPDWFHFEQSTSHFAPVVYILDYTSQKYIYVDEGCYDLFGYTAKQWKEEGIDWFLSRWHPIDFKIMNSKIFSQNMLFLQSIPPERYKDIVFSNNYRVLNPKGEYINILQRSSYIPSVVPGKPSGSIGAAFDITHFKQDVSIIHTIEEVKILDGLPVNNLLYKKVFPVEETQSLVISKRETEILKWMAKGFSSKQIADNLGLSINTINNHRKNMLYKTSCRSSSELMNYAVKHGLV